MNGLRNLSSYRLINAIILGLALILLAIVAFFGGTGDNSNTVDGFIIVLKWLAPALIATSLVYNHLLSRKIGHSSIQEMQQMERRLEMSGILMRSVSDAILVVSQDRGGVLFSNNSARQIYGYTGEELQQMNTLTFLSEGTGSLFDRYERELKDKGFFHHPETGIHKSGRRVETSIFGREIEYEGERSLLLIISDYTHLHRLQGRNREISMRFEEVLSSIPDGVWEIDFSQKEPTVELSPRFYDLLGYVNEAFPATLDGLTDTLVQEEKKKFREYLEKFVEEKRENFSLKLEFQGGDHLSRIMHLRGKTVSRSSGQTPARVVGTINDLSREMTLENELNNERHYTQVILDGVSNPVFLLDSSARILRINDVALEHLSQGEDDLHFKDIGDVLSLREEDGSEVDIQRLVFQMKPEDGAHIQHNLQMESDKSTFLGITFYLRNLFDVEGTPVGSVLVLRRNIVPSGQQPAEAPGTARDRLNRSSSNVGGGKTILVVDDDSQMRFLVREILERNGFRVRLAADGRKALDDYNENRKNIDLVLMDIKMPGLTGDSAFRVLHGIDPNLPILLTSGYVGNADVQDLIEKGAAGFIAKPYKQEELVKLLLEVLQGV